MAAGYEGLNHSSSMNTGSDNYILGLLISKALAGREWVSCNKITLAKVMPCHEPLRAYAKGCRLPVQNTSKTIQNIVLLPGSSHHDASVFLAERDSLLSSNCPAFQSQHDDFPGHQESRETHRQGEQEHCVQVVVFHHVHNVLGASHEQQTSCNQAEGRDQV